MLKSKEYQDRVVREKEKNDRKALLLTICTYLSIVRPLIVLSCYFYFYIFDYEKELMIVYF